MDYGDLIRFVLMHTFGLLIFAAAVSVLVFILAHKTHGRLFAFAVSSGFFFLTLFFLGSRLIPSTVPTFGPADGPAIKLAGVFEFFKKSTGMERVADIARNPNDVPAPIVQKTDDLVKIELEAKEIIGAMADGIDFNYWTFNGTVPGPLLRVRENDTVEFTLKNHPTSIHPHSIDLHAVTGPGGGAVATNVMPGESKTFTFKALHPGLYVYHCAHPNAATHMAHGMYGLILVEPAEGLPEVDHEFYVMQGEFYSTGELGDQGLQIFDAKKMLQGSPEYVVFNGKTNGAAGNMHINTGDRVRLFVGNGGVNLVSSFHIIGEIFDTVYPEAAMGQGSAMLKNVQTTLVPAGGAAIVEFVAEVPGRYILVDHALSRLDKGAWGTIEVIGEPRPDVFNGTTDGHMHGH